MYNNKAQGNCDNVRMCAHCGRGCSLHADNIKMGLFLQLHILEEERPQSINPPTKSIFTPQNQYARHKMINHSMLHMGVLVYGLIMANTPHLHLTKSLLINYDILIVTPSYWAKQSTTLIGAHRRSIQGR